MAERHELTGQQYVIASEVVVTVLDEDTVRRQALERVGAVRFDDEGSRARTRAAVEAEVAEALSFVAEPGKILAVDGVHVRSAGYTVRAHSG
jgi:hypothetical protein